MKAGILAAAFVLGSALPVWAQAETTTVQLLTRASRQGTITSASTTIPAGTQSVLIEGDIPTADMTDPANRLIARVFISGDSGATWILAFSAQWQGGTGIDKWTGQVVPNRLIFGFGPLDDYAGWLVRGELDIPQQMRVGLILTINPPPRI